MCEAAGVQAATRAKVAAVLAAVVCGCGLVGEMSNIGYLILCTAPTTFFSTQQRCDRCAVG